MTGWIGITLGDLSGIGLEVTLKALADLGNDDSHRYLLIGDIPFILRENQRLGLNLPFERYDSPPGAASSSPVSPSLPSEGGEGRGEEVHSDGLPPSSVSSPFVPRKERKQGVMQPCSPRSEGRFFLSDPRREPLPARLTPGCPEAAHAALAYLTDGAQRCLRCELDALVTAPVNKEAILRTGRSFVGQTEFLTELSKAERTAMMLLGEDDRGRWLRVALATTHVPLRAVADQLTQAKIETAIDLAARACKDLGLDRARVGVCGLNPHAGEGGKLGTEELTVITPAVRAAQQRQIDVHGPIAADALFYQAFQGQYDAVVAMYHDQGLVPLKMIGFERGVNWTLGLPFIRTSPDHGTAYDIAGQGKANPSSMLAAISLAKQLMRSRSEM